MRTNLRSRLILCSKGVGIAAFLPQWDNVGVRFTVSNSALLLGSVGLAGLGFVLCGISFRLRSQERPTPRPPVLRAPLFYLKGNPREFTGVKNGDSVTPT